MSAIKKAESLEQDNSNKQLQTSLGWCITGHHADCPYQIKYGKCGCSCHIKMEEK